MEQVAINVTATKSNRFTTIHTMYNKNTNTEDNTMKYTTYYVGLVIALIVLSIMGYNNHANALYAAQKAECIHQHQLAVLEVVKTSDVSWVEPDTSIYPLGGCR